MQTAEGFNGGQEIWTLASRDWHWMSYYPLEPGRGRADWSILKDALDSVGVGPKGRDPIEYIKSLVELRRGTGKAPASPDKFQAEVMSAR